MRLLLSGSLSKKYVAGESGAQFLKRRTRSLQIVRRAIWCELQQAVSTAVLPSQKVMEAEGPRKTA